MSIKLTRRAALASLAAGTACLCGCDVRPKPDGLISDLPYPGPEEITHGLPPTVNLKDIEIPNSPRTQVATEMGQIIPRSAWTKAGPDTSKTRPMDGVKLITFHHSGDGKPFTATDTATVAKHIEAVRQYHRQRGMVDIGYHFAIDGAGRIWQLRDRAYEGQHVRIGKNGVHWNEHNLGVVVLGDYGKQTPTPATKTRIASFSKFLIGFYKLPASAVHIHGELVETDCPGGALGPWIQAMRKTL